jgi:NAD(P)-dependent dehydrogenase (short-subunit alcohol dehydrogenase family)
MPSGFLPSLTKQRVLIVGGSSGIGLATAQLAADADAEVVITGRNAERLAEAERTISGESRSFHLSYDNPDSVEKLMTTLKQIDHLVLAGSSDVAWGPFHEISLAQLERYFHGKLFGYWRTIQAALNILRADGSITLLAGVAGRVTLPSASALAAVNGAVIQFGRALAQELAPIRVNVVSPGFIDTPAYDALPAARKQEIIDEFSRKLPVGRVGAPKDVAPTILLLMASNFTTGATFDIDGGQC